MGERRQAEKSASKTGSSMERLGGKTPTSARQKGRQRKDKGEGCPCLMRKWDNFSSHKHSFGPHLLFAKQFHSPPGEEYRSFVQSTSDLIPTCPHDRLLMSYIAISCGPTLISTRKNGLI